MRLKLVIILLSCLCLPLVSYAKELPVGTIINQILETDIKAYIDGNRIPSMNIDGRTVIVAEDLRYYGFDVVWNPVNRTLSITKNQAKDMDPLEIKETGSIIVGKKIGDVLYTDIKTYLNDVLLLSYNIDGKTAILLRDLSSEGSVNWDPEKRMSSFTSVDLTDGKGAEEESNSLTFQIEKIHTTEVIIDARNQKYFYGQDEVGFHSQHAMISLKFLAEKLGYGVVKYESSYTVKKGNYSFKISGNSHEVQRFYDGAYYRSDELLSQPLTKNNDLFIYDADMAFIFGLDKTWVPITGAIQLNYTDYNVLDFGNYEIEGERFIARTSIDYGINYGSAVNNKTLGSQSTDRTGSFDDTTNRVLYQQVAMLGDGNNILELVSNYNGRLLMVKTLEGVVPDYKSHALEEERRVGPSAYIRMIAPLKGYMETRDHHIVLIGEMEGSTDKKIRVEVEKLDVTTQHFIPADLQTIDIIDHGFSTDVEFSEGTGLYKLTAYATVSYTHGLSGEQELFRIFVTQIQR